MEWLLTLGIAVITGGVTLSGVALQNNAAAKRMKAEIAERASAEAIRFDREEATVIGQQAAVERAEAAALASHVTEEFSRDLDEVRSFRETDDDGFRTWFGDEWRRSKEVALRRVVGRVRKEDDRIALTEVIHALAVQDEFTRWNTTRTARSFVDGVLLLGLEIAMAMERGEEESADLISRRADMARRLGEWEHYVAMKEASEWEEARQAFKLEELQWEAQLDAAHEAQEEYLREMAEDQQWESDAAHEERDAARGAEARMHTFDE